MDALQDGSTFLVFGGGTTLSKEWKLGNLWDKITHYIYIILYRDSVLRYNPDIQDWEVTQMVSDDPDLVFGAVKVPASYMDCEL